MVNANKFAHHLDIFNKYSYLQYVDYNLTWIQSAVAQYFLRVQAIQTTRRGYTRLDSIQVPVVYLCSWREVEVEKERKKKKKQFCDFSNSNAIVPLFESGYIE